MPTDDPLTDLEASAARTGRRFWSMRSTDFQAFESSMRSALGIPRGVGTRAVTLRAMSPAEDMPVANDGSGKILVNLERGWVSGNVPVGNSPHVTELTDAEYQSLLPPQTGPL